jgi:hypothetical protein
MDSAVWDSNPAGPLTNLAGVLLFQEALLEARLDPAMAAAHTAIGLYNSLAVALTTGMVTRSASPISYHLLKGFATQQRGTWSAPPSIYDHITK